MLSKKVQETLNKQIQLEADSSNLYLAMASWAENQGLSGTAEFLYRHSDEERKHMLKLVRYVNERGGQAKIPAIKQPTSNFNSLTALFQGLFKHEVFVSEEINNVIDICLKEKDFTEIFIKLSRDVHFLNDDRAKIKLEINNLTGSKIKEIK